VELEICLFAAQLLFPLRCCCLCVTKRDESVLDQDEFTQSESGIKIKSKLTRLTGQERGVLGRAEERVQGEEGK
jgi:hypothetical protein